jgi:hypothetical protein
MKEFMLFIRNEGNPIANFSREQQQEHVQKIGEFIKKMVESGHMKAAQPLEMEGSIVSFKNGKFIDGPFNESKEVISGYYHLKAENLDQAIEIAKSDPRFQDGDWRIEVRPIMKVEGIN